MDTLLNPEFNNRIFCYYVNPTDQIQITRITNIPNWYFEKIVFPKQRLIFEAVPEAILEIHTGIMASAIFTDRIRCNLLRVEEEVKRLHLKAEIA